MNEEREGTRSKAVPLLTVLILILLAALAVLGWFYYQQQQESEATQAQLMADKDSISRQLLITMSDLQEMESNNLEINRRLTEEQAHAQKLYDELQSLKRVSYAKIKEYQKELGTLRSIMKGMLRDIDSLNTMNKELIAENRRVKAEVTQAQETVKSLEQRTETLSSQVAKGSVVQARKIVAVGVNEKGKAVPRAKRVNKIRTCLTLMENSIAKPGSKTVYMRIIGPDEFVLAQSEADLFEFEGNRIVFSAARDIDYQNADVDMCIYYDCAGTLIPGQYSVDIYLEGNLIGHTSFSLK
ncbi:MAG: hypothetical protein IJU72_01425 [Bacteroidales bacterium]|nr:hypothetical protein [Bacteroidales bacterium]